MMRANLGCGGQIVEGWINIDTAFPPDATTGGAFNPEDFMQVDMRQGLPFGEHILDFAVAHHLLDLFTPTELRAFLAEAHRVIKPHGVLRISLADMRGAIMDAERERWEFFHMLHQPDDAYGLDLLNEYLGLHGARKTFLTAKITCNVLKQAGFEPYIVAKDHTVYGDNEICALDTRGHESIFLEGVA